MTTLEKLEELIYHGSKETDRRFQETDRRFQEAARSSQETDRRFQEAARSSQETDRRFQETARSLQELAAGFQETRKLLKETDKKIDRVAKQVGDITDSLGRFAESTVFPSVIPLFKKQGIDINQLWGRLPSVQNGREMELDIAGLGPDCAVVVEVKLRLKQEHVEKILKTLPEVFDYFPLLQRPVLYGGVAAMSIDKDVDRFAYKQGLFVLTQTGDNLRIWNDKAFKPRSFSTSQRNGAQKRKKT